MPLKKNIYLKTLLLFLLCICYYPVTVSAQVYANAQTNSVTGLCLLCGVSNPNNPVDNSSLTDYATLNITAGLLGVSVSQTLLFPAAGSAGCDSLVVGIGTGDVLLSANVLGSIAVQTFNGSVANNDLQTVSTGILSLLPGNNKGEIIWKPAKSFDRVQITLNSSLLGVLSSLRIYYANTRPAAPAPVILPAVPAICTGDSITLRADTLPATTVRWYNAAVNGSLLKTGNTLTVSPAVTTTYYAAATVNGCTSTRRAVTVTVNPRPANPVYTVPQQPVCGSIPVTVTNYQAGINYRVRVKYVYIFNTVLDTAYTVAGSNTFYTPGIISPGPVVTTIGVQAINAATGCKSDTVSRGYIVGGSGRYPSTDADSITICKGDSTTLHAYNAVSGVTQILWYDAPAGGNLLHTGDFYKVAPAATTVYYAANKLNCEFPVRRPVTVFVKKLADPVYTVPDGFICGSAKLVVQNHQPGYNYKVRIRYRYLGNILLLDTAYTVINKDTITTPAFVSGYTAQADIYVQAVDLLTNCKSDSTHMIYNVDASTNGPAVIRDSVRICAGDSATLYAYDPLFAFSIVNWYDAPAGGNLLFRGSYYKVSPATDRTYYVTTALGCEYPVRLPVRVYVDHCPPPLHTTLAPAAKAGGQDFRIFPNPSTGTLQFDDKKELAGSMISISNSEGKLVYRGTLRANRLELPSGIPAGLYFITAVTPAKVVYNTKIVLRR